MSKPTEKDMAAFILQVSEFTKPGIPIGASITSIHKIVENFQSHFDMDFVQSIALGLKQCEPLNLRQDGAADSQILHLENADFHKENLKFQKKCVELFDVFKKRMDAMQSQIDELRGVV